MTQTHVNSAHVHCVRRELHRQWNMIPAAAALHGMTLPLRPNTAYRDVLLPLPQRRAHIRVEAAEHHAPPAVHGGCRHANNGVHHPVYFRLRHSATC
jgi:hypothetical protein